MTNLVTASEIAELLHVKPSTVLAWARKGIIPCMRGSRRCVLFQADDVESALKQRGNNTCVNAGDRDG